MSVDDFGILRNTSIKIFAIAEMEPQRGGVIDAPFRRFIVSDASAVGMFGSDRAR